MTEGTTSGARVQSAFKAGSAEWAPQQRPLPLPHREHTDVYSPHPVHVEMEEFSDVRFKQRAVIEFLTADKVIPI
jgi:hypothetical protein